MNGITKLQRWLDLIAFLVGRRLPVSVEEIMEGIPAYAEKWVEGSGTDRASARRSSRIPAPSRPISIRRLEWLAAAASTTPQRTARMSVLLTPYRPLDLREAVLHYGAD